LRVEELDPEPDADGEAALEVLCAGFVGDPALRWCFLADEPGFAGRLRGYMEVGHAWHTGAGQPVAGIRHGGSLAAIAYIMTPRVEMAPETADALRRSLAERCGPRFAARFFRYEEAVSAIEVPGPAYILALLAVRPEHQGRGLGSALVAYVSALCDGDPGSQGVVLDTGTERLVHFYERRGYRRMGVAVVADEEGAVGGVPLRESVLFRPRRAERLH
jgi:GNAT superfamily N-acetyltransferase